MRRLWSLVFLTVIVLAALAQTVTPAPFHFILLGDRTGDIQAGVWEQVWKQAAAENPAFFAGGGDTIEGGNDATVKSEWQQVETILAPYKRFPLYLAPGNHDVWSPASAALFLQYTVHPLHYSFDYGPAHFTVLDNSESDALPAAEFAFLEADLREHQAQPVKFILSHRPFWLVDAVMRNTHAEFQQLARKYGVRYVIAGHVHQMLHVDVENVTYLSLPSAGGHLRGSMQYEDGWFFGYIVVTVQGNEVTMRIRELAAPQGKARATTPADWGLTGLTVRP